MSSHQEFFTLSNGNKIPAIAIVGTGTRWYKQEETADNFSKELVDQLKYALTLPGTVHLDAAEVYRTYPEFSEALKQTSKSRDEIFITDKYSTQLKVTKDPIEGLETSLKRNNLEYVDLYLLHSPFISKEKNGFTLEEAWQQMEQLYKEGKAKNIGVSNFSVDDLQKLMATAKILPQVNQIEHNAFLLNQTPGIVNFCQDHKILVEAYSPLGPFQKKSEANAEFYEYIKSLAEKYGKTEAQVLLRWVTDNGILPVTTSSKKERIENAQNLFTFDLTKEEVEKITELGRKNKAQRLYWNSEYDKFNAFSQSKN
ncbi:NADPH-dependent alpha-keto amide reductase [Monosporozyma servazzii]